MSRYIRTVDLNALSKDGFDHQMLWVGESCRWLAATIGPKSEGTGRHVHEVDQWYYVVEGELSVALGSEELVAGPHTLIFVPAGTAHRSWNATEEREFHIEALAPGPDPGKAPWTDSDTSDAPGGHFVRKVEDVEIDPKVKEFDRRLLLQKTDNSEHMMLYEALLKPGEKGQGLHVHSIFDQFYYVLEGSLTCQVGLEQCTVGPQTLVVLPADMPHDMWNDSSENERHLSMITPAPVPGATGAHIGVELSAV